MRKISAEQVLSSIDKTDACWLWTGRVNQFGYGKSSAQLAHRRVWEILRGPIPEGLQLDHLCRVKLCVNPDHLEPVSARENMRRATVLVTHCKRGHEFTPENTHTTEIPYRRRGGETGVTRRRACRACSRENTRRYLERKQAAA